MQHERHADPGTEVLRIGGDRLQGLGGHREQQAVDQVLVGICQGADWRRQGKDDVVIVQRQQFGLPRLKPALG
jgi:hypothetical protein